MKFRSSRTSHIHFKDWNQRKTKYDPKKTNWFNGYKVIIFATSIRCNCKISSLQWYKNDAVNRLSRSSYVRHDSDMIEIENTHRIVLIASKQPH